MSGIHHSFVYFTSLSINNKSKRVTGEGILRRTLCRQKCRKLYVRRSLITKHYIEDENGRSFPSFHDKSSNTEHGTISIIFTKISNRILSQFFFFATKFENFNCHFLFRFFSSYSSNDEFLTLFLSFETKLSFLTLA